MNETLKVLLSAQSKKALTAGFVALVGGLGASMADGNLTGGEFVVAVGAGLVAVAATFGVTNAEA